MAEYIEREEAVNILRAEAGRGATPYHIGIYAAARAVESIPAADVRPVVRGKCVEMFDSDGYPTRNHWLCCSICGHVAPFGRMSDTESHTNFCPNCGADMRPTSMSGANGEES